MGERGREVRDFAEDTLGDAMSRTVLVAVTSDRSPLERLTAPWVAITIAEHFQAQGNVLLVADSITRSRTRRVRSVRRRRAPCSGLPTSFFATIPQLLERMGRLRSGSITGLLTVLVDGDEEDDPVADALRGLLDGHISLSPELARSGHYPAIDVLDSLSRLMPKLADGPHQANAQAIRELLAAFRDGRDLVDVGAYQPGSNRVLDTALERMPMIDAFLRQDVDDPTSLEETVQVLDLIVDRDGVAAA